MNEVVKQRTEFEHIPLHEVEQKFIPLFPEQLAGLKSEAIPIEQFYLSHPSEGFSLRFRETPTGDDLTYEATLKTSGEVTADGLKRLEVTAPVSPDMYQFYRENVPTLRKLRAEPVPNVVIDFYEDGHIQMESEHPISWQKFCHDYNLAGQYADLTGDHIVDNEWRAHFEYRRNNSGAEALQPLPDLSTNEIVDDILNSIQPGAVSVVKIRGRSGSGKSTLVKEIQQQLLEQGIESDVISTDDYHRGQAWLEAHNNGQPWIDWDDQIVYDTDTMAKDLEKLTAGQPVPRRRIDFTIVEPVYEGDRTPTSVLLVEGIYANAPEIAKHCELEYEMPTPVATSIGRRLLRDMLERPQFADPVASLRYMLEYAEPAYRKQTT